MLIDIDKTSGNRCALIRIYQNYCVLNEHAAELLQLLPCARLHIKCESNNRAFVYIARTDSPTGYPIKQRGRCFKVYSTALCTSLAKALQGYGAYRICEEDTIRDKEEIYFNIFFRKFER